jgi:hypothetical protein
MHTLRLLLNVCLFSLAVSDLFAAGGTEIVATKGQPAFVQETWPKGVAEIVNDPVRTTGWNDWFSEWPNDVNQYALEAQTLEDVNRLIAKLASVESDLKEIRLCAMKEPAGLGWVTSIPQGNEIPVMLTIGDQSRVDQWYARVRKPFGQIEFEDCPVAVPPTLTLFVQNPLIDLEKLQIPQGITVKEGYLPTGFHKSYTKQEREQREKAQAAPPVKGEPLPSEAQAAHDRIRAFLKKREAAPQGISTEIPGGPAPVLGNASPVDLLAWDRYSSSLYTTGKFNGLGQWMFSIRGNTAHGELVGCELNHLVRMPNHANSMAVGGRMAMDGRLPFIVTGTTVGTVELRASDTLQPKQTFKVGPEYGVYAVAIDHEGQQVAGLEGWRRQADAPFAEDEPRRREDGSARVRARWKVPRESEPLWLSRAVGSGEGRAGWFAPRFGGWGAVDAAVYSQRRSSRRDRSGGDSVLASAPGTEAARRGPAGSGVPALAKTG